MDIMFIESSSQDHFQKRINQLYEKGYRPLYDTFQITAVVLPEHRDYLGSMVPPCYKAKYTMFMEKE